MCVCGGEADVACVLCRMTAHLLVVSQEDGGLWLSFEGLLLDAHLEGAGL